MKKTISTLLAALLTLTLLLGGVPAFAAEADVNEDGTVNNPEDVVVDENSLAFWSLFSGGDGGFMEQIVNDYNEQNSGRDVTFIMLVWADYYTKLGTAVAANKGPDIGVSHASKLPELVTQGFVAPINEYADAVGVNWADYDQSIIDAVTFDGQVYGIPLDTHAEILYFNKDMIEAAGIELVDGKIDFGSSEDEFYAVLDQIQASLPEGTFTLAFPSAGDDPYRIWWATYFQMGGPALIGDDGVTVTMDAEIAQKSADFVKGLYDKGYIPMGAQETGKMFQAGQSALFVGGTWSTGQFEGQDGFNFGAQAYPSPFGTEACWADAHIMILPTNNDRSAEETQDAVDFMYYASSKGGLTWAMSGQIPSNNAVLNSQEYKDLPFRSDYAEAAKTAVYPSKNENFYAVKDLLIRNLDEIWNGTTDSATAIQNILSEMEMALF